MINQSICPSTQYTENVYPMAIFPRNGKWLMSSPFTKKWKNLANNYRPISLLPICGKIFEKLIFENLYQYIFSNNFISDNQSGYNYKRGDSTIKQLLAITHDIHQSFDDKHEIRAVFLDISKAFDSVWHQGLVNIMCNSQKLFNCWIPSLVTRLIIRYKIVWENILIWVLKNEFFKDLATNRQ